MIDRWFIDLIDVYGGFLVIQVWIMSWMGYTPEWMYSTIGNMMINHWWILGHAIFRQTRIDFVHDDTKIYRWFMNDLRSGMMIWWHLWFIYRLFGAQARWTYFPSWTTLGLCNSLPGLPHLVSLLDFSFAGPNDFGSCSLVLRFTSLALLSHLSICGSFEEEEEVARVSGGGWALAPVRCHVSPQLWTPRTIPRP